MLLDLVMKNRSYRRFKQDVPVSLETLKELVNLARLSASGANRQPLKYFLSAATEKNRAIFPCLGWGFTPAGCSRFVAGKIPKDPQTSTGFNRIDHNPSNSK